MFNLASRSLLGRKVILNGHASIMRIAHGLQTVGSLDMIRMKAASGPDMSPFLLCSKQCSSDAPAWSRYDKLTGTFLLNPRVPSSPPVQREKLQGADTM